MAKKKDKNRGNLTSGKIWEARTTLGRPRLFSSPESLWNAACEYFQWVDDNPIVVIDVGKAGDHFGERIEIPHQRPYTIEGLAVFLDCDKTTLLNYGTREGYEDFFTVVTKIKETMYSQKFSGASVGIFNAMIISRDLGLKDHQEVTGADGRPLMGAANSDEQASASRTRLLAMVNDDDE
jgi:hypothetical protein